MAPAHPGTEEDGLLEPLKGLVAVLLEALLASAGPSSPSAKAAEHLSQAVR